MATWPAAGETDWNTKMLAYLAIEHNTDGTHSMAGRSVQVVNTQTGEVNTGTSVIPHDDTIPQKTEGDEYMTLAITPTNASNKLKIEVVLFSHCVDEFIVTSLFQDSTADALMAGSRQSNSDSVGETIFTHYMVAGTTSPTTFKVRAGSSSTSTLTFNGRSGARLLGSVMASSITITEITV